MQPLHQWQPGPMPLQGAKNALVFVMINDPVLRKTYEADWVLALRKQKLKAGPSYAVINSIHELDLPTLKLLQQRHQLDSIFVATIGLMSDSDNPERLGLSDFLEQQASLGFDVFIQQMQSARVQLVAFSLLNESMRWQAEFEVPVQGLGVDWKPVARESAKLILQAGMQPELPKKKQKEKAERKSKDSASS
ncbi:MAG: hypothetical protein MI867_14555 [Pseudomonadales bacterium]|nr:hypothetical protein [Pseudomonadales bacterium]